MATDCLSEGINLQDHFDAIVHYDLAWSPTRHEQREGRVDRFGQAADKVRVITYYGTDNQIDGIVLDVLLRKHRQIQKSLGVAVPVPAASGDVMEAIFEGLLLREQQGADASQLTLFDVSVSPRPNSCTWSGMTQRSRSAAPRPSSPNRDQGGRSRS